MRLPLRCLHDTQQRAVGGEDEAHMIAEAEADAAIAESIHRCGIGEAELRQAGIGCWLA